MSNEPGSAMHIHQSLEDMDGNNLFGTSERGNPICSDFIAGLQKYTPAVTPCWRRTSTPTAASPLARARRASSGGGNRTCGLRVPLRTECTPAEPLRRGRAQPYLALAPPLACGYLGMLEALDPCREMRRAPDDLPYSLPRSLGIAEPPGAV